MNPDYWAQATRHLSRQCPTMKTLITQYHGEGLRARGNGFYTLLRSIVGQQISVKAADSVWARVEQAVTPLTPHTLLSLSDEALRACGLSASKVAYAKNVAMFYESHQLMPSSDAGVTLSPRGRGSSAARGEGAISLADTPHAPSPKPSPARGEGSLAARSIKKSSDTVRDEAMFWVSHSDDEVIALLTSIKGIGVWTAEMFLIFHLLRPDVFPVGDLGLLKAINLQLVPPAKLKTQKWLKPKEYKKISERWAPYRTVATWYLWRSLDPVPVEY